MKNDLVKEQINKILDEYCQRTSTPFTKTVKLADDIRDLLEEQRKGSEELGFIKGRRFEYEQWNQKHVQALEKLGQILKLLQ